jgi:RNA polymerase sigma factor (sigma-70 family)
MKWELATNDQLLTIIKFDFNCPHSLLSGAVIEMLNRSMFDNIIADAVRKSVHLQIFENTYKIGLEDFMQNARMAIFSSIKNYQTGKGTSFFTFAYMVAKQSVFRIMESVQTIKRDTRNVVSYQAEMNDGENFEIMLEDKKTNVEHYVITKLFLEQLLKQVNPHQRTVVYLYLQGYNFREISERLGRGSFSTMSQAYNKAIRRMRKGA